jgi:hypothetical protein
VSAGPVVVGGSNFDLVVQVQEEITLDGSSHSGRLHLRLVNQAAYLYVALLFLSNLFNQRQRARKLTFFISKASNMKSTIEIVRVPYCAIGPDPVRYVIFGQRHPDFNLF